MRCIAIKDLGDLPKTRFVQMILKALKPCGSKFPASLAAEGLSVGSNERTHQPRPDGPLMICTIAAAGIAFVFSDVIGIAWRQCAQTSWRQQIAFDDSKDALALVSRNH